MNILKSISKVVLLFSLFLIVFSCGGSDSPDPDPVPPPVVKDPEKALLVSPKNNQECADGTVISDTESKISFDWGVAKNTTSYTLSVKNLDTDNVKNYNTNTDKYDLNLERGVPYSWYVVSKSSNTTNTATSDTWKFYLAGNGTVNYAPFPAELVSPLNEETITGMSVSLEWKGSDVDGDIKEYDVYLDKNVNPTTKVDTVVSQKLENQTVEAGASYYWKVVTRDEIGNTSISQVFSFKVN